MGRCIIGASGGGDELKSISRAALAPYLHGATLDKIDDEPHDDVRFHLTGLDGSVPTMIDGSDEDGGP